MKTTGPFSQYNRAIALRKPDPDRPEPEMDKSLLGFFGALEIPFLYWLVSTAQADGTTYST